ncbi:hypothetical protein BGW80DRAFT_1460292 [Lactifluus volemus]|nr:hypothetical protein BGW80DRAFT_1460292 [Lactifluus volemus]
MAQSPIDMNIGSHSSQSESQGKSPTSGPFALPMIQCLIADSTKAFAPDSFSIAGPHPSCITVSLSEEQRFQDARVDIWPMYNSLAQKHDTQLSERWKVQTDSTMFFSSLFSVTVSAFLVGGISGLRQNSTDLLLAQISHQLADTVDTPSSSRILFTRPTELDIAMTVLWAISLVLSLTCAFSTILVQTWIREYLDHSQCHPIPSTRARIRSYLFQGLSSYRLDQVIKAIPLLLHLAFLLFGAGLITCFFSLNNIAAYVTLGAYSVVGVSYFFLTILSLIDLSSPFKTPISNLLWRSLQLIHFTILSVTQHVTSVICPHSFFSRIRLPKIINVRRELFRGGVTRALERDLENAPPNMDAHSLQWAISYMYDDSALESFVAAIPNFLDSEHHCYPQYTIGHLMEDRDVRLGWSIGRLLQTCSSSSSALEPHARKRRAIACMRAIWSVTEKFAGMSSLYWDTLFGVQTAEALSILRNDADPSIALVAWCTAALAARSCLRELTDVSSWIQTKGPYWTTRAQQLVNLIGKLVAAPFPPDDLKVVAQDGPLLTLAVFLSTVAHSVAQVDATISLMISTTIGHLADGVRAGEATLDAQTLLTSEAFSPDTYERWKGYLGPIASRATCLTVASLHQELAAFIPGDLRPANLHRDLPVPLEQSGVGVLPSGSWMMTTSQRQRSSDSSQTAFSGDGA